MLHQTGARLWLLATFTLLPLYSSFSQSFRSDSTAARVQASFPVHLYRLATKTESHLYNGPEYVDYRKPFRQGHQFFLEDEAAPGSVVYDGARYEQVPMLYDLVKDEAIIIKNGILKQKLVSDKVVSFSLNGHFFIRYLGTDSLNGIALPTGFYDLMIDQDVKLFIKRSKRIKEDRTNVENNMPVEIYLPDDKYYILKDQKYYQVKRRKSVYQVFRDKKKELKKYARQNKLQFKKQREEAIIAMVHQYNSLLNHR